MIARCLSDNRLQASVLLPGSAQGRKGCPEVFQHGRNRQTGLRPAADTDVARSRIRRQPRDQPGTQLQRLHQPGPPARCAPVGRPQRQFQQARLANKTQHQTQRRTRIRYRVVLMKTERLAPPREFKGIEMLAMERMAAGARA